MNHQYHRDALFLMQGLCTHVSCQTAAANGAAGVSNYTEQRSTIQRVFDMTNGVNYNLQSIVLRLTVIDSLYSTNAKYSYYAIDRLAETIANLGTERGASDYFYHIACGGADCKNIFKGKYGIRKNLKEGSRQISLISKYAYYALLQDVAAYPLGFPIFDSLVKDVYPRVCELLCIKPRKEFFNKIESYVAALSDIRKVFYGTSSTLFCGLQQFDALDIYLWRMGKLKKGNYSLLLGQEDYTAFIQNLHIAQQESSNFDDLVWQNIKNMPTATAVACIKHDTIVGQMIDHWKTWF